jgi:hypothetical protein
MHRTIKTACASLAALLALGVVPMAATPTAGAVPVASPSSLSLLAGKLADKAQTDGTAFGGVYVNEATHKVHLDLVGDVQGEAKELVPNGSDRALVTIDKVTRPMSTLTSMVGKIIAAKTSLAADGVHVEKAAVNEATNGLTVGISPGSNPQSLSILEQRFPGIPIGLQYLRVLSSSGSADYEPGPPWITGMEIYKLFYSGSTLEYTACTAGFNVIDPSTGDSYMTTASHCFNVGDTILHSTGSVGQRIGTVTARAGFGTIADSELITPTDDDVPNTILVNNSTQLNVSGYFPTTAVGTSLCKSGVTTGETCGNVVESTDATVCYTSGCFYDQEETTNATIGEVAYYGDSGGPVYMYNNSSSVIAAGTVSGFEEECAASGSDCSLDGVMFFTPIQNMKETLGVVP